MHPLLIAAIANVALVTAADAFVAHDTQEHLQEYVPINDYPELEPIVGVNPSSDQAQAQAEADNVNLERRQRVSPKANSAITHALYFSWDCWVSSSSTSLTTILNNGGISAVDSNTNYNAETCFQKCKANSYSTTNPNYFHFGLSNGNSNGGKCWCATTAQFEALTNVPGKITHPNTNQCIACNNGKEDCGSGATSIWFYRTFSIGSDLDVIGNNVRKFQYMDCYDDSSSTRTLADKKTTWLKPLTAAGCAVTCSGSTYTHFGLEWYNQCWCGTLNSSAVTSTRCTLPCLMDPTSPSTCGGAGAINVYKYVSSLTANSPKTILSVGSGRVIANVQVNILLWGSGVANTQDLAPFYTAIVSSQSNYWKVLNQYNNIGTGSYVETTTLGTSTTGGTLPRVTGTIDNDAIRTYLTNYLNGKTKTVNSYYSIHLPSGLSVTNFAKTSCVDFCAYHDTISVNSVTVTYAVFPDISSSSCKCFLNSDYENRMAVISHDLVEVVTDPDWDSTGKGTGWVQSNAFNEITDVCTNQRGWITIGSTNYPVTAVWSNRAGACVFS